MQLVVLSYRQRHEEYRGCGQYEMDCEADLEFHSADSTDDIARWIAERIQKHPEATYSNLVYENWANFYQGAQCSVYEGGGENSVFVPGEAWSEDEDGDERERRRNELCSEIRSLVKDKLGKLSEEAKRKAEEEKRRKEVEAVRLREEARKKKDKEDFARLQATYGKDGPQ